MAIVGRLFHDRHERNGNRTDTGLSLVWWTRGVSSANRCELFRFDFSYFCGCALRRVSRENDGVRAYRIDLNLNDSGHKSLENCVRQPTDRYGRQLCRSSRCYNTLVASTRMIFRIWIFRKYHYTQTHTTHSLAATRNGIPCLRLAHVACRTYCIACGKWSGIVHKHLLLHRTWNIFRFNLILSCVFVYYFFFFFMLFISFFLLLPSVHFVYECLPELMDKPIRERRTRSINKRIWMKIYKFCSLATSATRSHTNSCRDLSVSAADGDAYRNIQPPKHWNMLASKVCFAVDVVVVIGIAVRASNTSSSSFPNELILFVHTTRLRYKLKAEKTASRTSIDGL